MTQYEVTASTRRRSLLAVVSLRCQSLIRSAYIQLMPMGSTFADPESCCLAQDCGSSGL